MIDKLACARTATLLGSVLTSLSSGTNYVYSAYAPQLGSRLHITHTQLNIIGLCGNMGVYTTGPVVGRIADKHGPRILLIASFILLFSGYTGLRGYYDAGPSSEDKLPFLSLLIMSIFSYMTGAGGSAGLAASANSTAKSFPERMRATTMGFVLSGFGLSAFFFSTLAQWLYPGNTSYFLLFLSLGTSLLVVVGVFTVRPVPHAERPDAGPGGLTSLTETPDSTTQLINPSREQSLHGFVNVEMARDEDVYIPGESGEARATGVYPEFISAIGVSRSLELSRSRSRSLELSPTRRAGGHHRSSSRTPGGITRPVSPPEPADKYGKALLTGWEFWLLFSILSLLSGTGLMFINNVGSITHALSAKGNPKYDQVAAAKLQAAQVSIISVANCGARIGFGWSRFLALTSCWTLSLKDSAPSFGSGAFTGAGADFIKSRFAYHRSYLLSLVSILLLISQLMGSGIENVNHLWQASLILGLGYGGIFGLLPMITLEWFGIVHFSENWGFVSLAPLLGGNIFSIMFGRDFDAHVTETVDSRAPEPDSERQCFEGRLCYSKTLALTTFACALALILSLVVAWRDRRRASMTNKYDTLPQEVIWEDGAEE